MITPPLRTAWIAAMAGCLALAALGLPATGHAAEACKAKRLDLPVKMVGSRAIATVGINGTPVPLVVDSGAFFSMLTEPAAAQLKLATGPAPGHLAGRGLTGRLNLRITNVDRLKFAAGELPNVDFMVGGNEMGAGSMGLLGRNILATSDAEYDLAHGVVRLMYPEGDCSKTNMAYWADPARVVKVPLRTDPWDRLPELRVMVKLNGVEVLAMLDTGAQTLVSLAAARRAGVAAEAMSPAPDSYGLGQGSLKSWNATFASFTLGGEEVTQVKLRVADFSHDEVEMLLGIDWFLAHHVYVAKAQKQLFFTYEGGVVFARNEVPAVAGAASAPAADETLPDADAYARRGAAWTARREPARALADLDRACELAPSSAEYRLQRGQVQLALKNQAEALKDFDEALRLDPSLTDARWERALLRASRSAPEPALEDLQALDRLLAPQADQRLAMAQLYARLDRHALALPQLDQWLNAHRVEIRRPMALNSRCWARVLLNVALDQALADCNEALGQKADDPQFLDSRAWVRLRRGEARAAVADFDRGLKQRPEGAWSLYGRGIARLQLGDAEAGREDLQAARRLLPSIDEQAGRHGMAAEAAR